MTFQPERLRALLVALQIELSTLTETQTADTPEACRLCGAALRAHERPEQVCDHCLRVHQTKPGPAPTQLFEQLAA